MQRIVVPLVLAAWAASAAAAGAQPAPTPVPIPGGVLPGGIPSSVVNSPIVQSVLQALGGVTQTTTGPSAVGRVTYFRRFTLQLETAPNVYRRIDLHQGTIIEPRGATIQPNDRVSVSGQPESDGSLAANAITIQ